MPTIELICIGCSHVPPLPRYPSFAYQAEPRLISHRALFQHVLDRLTGVIVHLANNDLEGDTEVWFAGKIMDWSETDTNGVQVLIFLPETWTDLKDLMRRLLDASPQHRIMFSTDYQFGGKAMECGEVSLTEFFCRHDSGKLRYNTLFFIRQDA